MGKEVRHRADLCIRLPSVADSQSATIPILRPQIPRVPRRSPPRLPQQQKHEPNASRVRLEGIAIIARTL